MTAAHHFRYNLVMHAPQCNVHHGLICAELTCASPVRLCSPTQCVQVADALGVIDSDVKAQTWISTLAERTLATEWRRNRDANAMLCTLLLLPPHLLLRVLAACLSTHPLSALLPTLPAPLCQPLVTAAASTGTLTLHRNTLETALLHLASSPHHLSDLHTLKATADGSATHEYPAAAAPLLARALSAHPSLTALHLDATFLHTSWIRNLSAALSQDLTPALTDLRLGIRLLPAGLPELAACIRHVPTLTRLAIGTLLPPSAAAPIGASATSAL